MSGRDGEPRLLGAADIDRLAGLVFELCAQLHVERQQRMALERAVVARGVVAAADIARLAGDEGFLAEARAEADRSLRQLMRILAEDGGRKAPLRDEAP